MELKIGRRSKHTVVSLAQASEIYATARDESGEGYSTFPVGIIMGAAGPHYVSYNGKVWQGKPSQSDTSVCVFDPYAKVGAI